MGVTEKRFGTFYLVFFEKRLNNSYKLVFVKIISVSHVTFSINFFSYICAKLCMRLDLNPA